MQYIAVFFAFLFFTQNAFAEKYYIDDITKRKKYLYYGSSKVAEMVHNGKWQVYCEKGRKRGNSSDKYDTLRTATQFAMSICDKY
jgi:hypothetical protein